MAVRKAQGADFVSKIVKDPGNPPETLLYTGFLGSSSEKGYTRLYFDAQLSNYIEIPTKAILHTQDVPVEQSPLGEKYVWVKRDAELIHGKIGTSRIKAKFFEGPIVQDYAKAAQYGQIPLGSPVSKVGVNCTQITENCVPQPVWQEATPPLPSQLYLTCTLDYNSCTRICPSQNIPCITRSDVMCTRTPYCYGAPDYQVFSVDSPCKPKYDYRTRVQW